MPADLPRLRYGLDLRTLADVRTWRADGLSWATIARQLAWHAPTLFQHAQWAAQHTGAPTEAGCPDLDPAWPDATGRPRGPVLCESYPRCACGRGEHRLSAPGDGRTVEPPDAR